MSRHLLTLYGAADRARAMKYITAAPPGTRVELKAAKRSLDQNSKMWASLSDISAQLVWHGQKLTPDDWKLVFLDALKRELRLVPNIEGNGFVDLGRRSSDLTKDEMSQLIELMLAFGAKHGITFHDRSAIPSDILMAG
jgi:hypothetical protein